MEGTGCSRGIKDQLCFHVQYHQLSFLLLQHSHRQLPAPPHRQPTSSARAATHQIIPRTTPGFDHFFSFTSARLSSEWLHSPERLQLLSFKADDPPKKTKPQGLQNTPCLMRHGARDNEPGRSSRQPRFPFHRPNNPGSFKKEGDRRADD